jgi:hypothetical protein
VVAVIDFLGPHWCPKSCRFHLWWEWYSKRGKPAKPHVTGVTILGAAWYWGHGCGTEKRKKYPGEVQ